MNIEILSFSSFGYEGEIVKLEADLRRGLPVTDIVGLPGSAIKEARERVRAAIRNCGFDFPSGRILINLSPADQKKEGSGFDLPIALSILTAKEKTAISETDEDEDDPLQAENSRKPESPKAKRRVMIMGELELSGTLRPVNGVLGAISAGTENGIRYFIVPKENEAEASIPEQAQVFGAETLKEALEFLSDIQNLTEPAGGSKTDDGLEKRYVLVWTDTNTRNADFLNSNSDSFEGFEDVRGQDSLIRALEIAAAGRHNLIAYGPPGCGKTLSLRRFQTLLPDMDFKTARETTRIYSIAGLLPNSREKDILLKRPPFRMPHPNASMEGIIGGAGKCMPGEVSLAHGGVLFLDEAAQFKTSVLQTLRAPLETGEVTLSRAGRSSTFPADFQLLLAINPCPCGNFGSEGKICTCMPAEIERYWKKLTAPLLDRIDIRIPVFPPKADLFLKNEKYSTEKMRLRIKRAKELQWERSYKSSALPDSKIRNYENSNLLPKNTPKICIMTDEAGTLFSAAVEKKKLSGRGSHAILKISRTIADLEAAEKISSAHIEEAVSLRQWINYLPDFL